MHMKFEQMRAERNRNLWQQEYVEALMNH
jgi:hypothetical protein